MFYIVIRIILHKYRFYLNIYILNEYFHTINSETKLFNKIKLKYSSSRQFFFNLKYCPVCKYLNAIELLNLFNIHYTKVKCT